jgi:nucleoside-diphosphate-sugar epimerase
MGKILVTGATGFTGQNLCRRLTADGGQVVTFVRASSKIGPIQDMGVECRVVDIKDRRQIFNNFDEIDLVYHVAAAYRTEHTDLEEFRLVNVESVRHLLDASKEAGVQRFVHCSTVGVQGGIDHPPADEDYRMLPGDHYQQTKVEGELLARKYFAAGLRGTVVRPVGIYGPGDTRFLKLFRAINRGYFVMIGSGKTLYHMTYIDDLVDGFILCGTHPGALGEVFTIGGETYTTIRDLANHIADVLGKPHPRLRIPFWPVFAASMVCDKLCRTLSVSPPIYPRRVEFFHLDRAFSIEKAKRLLGYQPKVDLPEGLKRTAEWYREQGLL